jgi:hypothetical protein
MFRMFSIALTLAMVACGGQTRVLPQFDSAAPEGSAFQLAITEIPMETGQSAVVVASVMDPCLTQAEEAVQQFNQAIAGLLDPVAAALATDPEIATSSLHRWPTMNRDGADFRFSMSEADNGQFAWELEAKPTGSSDSTYAATMTGVFTPGGQYRRGSGEIGFDLDRLADIDSSFHGSGGLYLSFANTGPTVLAYRLDHFSPDLAVSGPITAVIYGVHFSHGVTNLRLATYGALCDSTLYKDHELVLMRLRWNPAIGGRADALSLLGDVPTGHAYVENAIWRSTLTSQWSAVRDCLLDGSTIALCNPLRTAGQAFPCDIYLQGENLPPLDATSTVAEPGANPLTPPTGMPTLF